MQAEVPVAQGVAFAVFTARFGEWWPREFSWSGERLVEIGIGLGMDALCSEEGPAGFRMDWGRVVAWQPPARVAFLWQIDPDRTPAPDPARASEVEVRFIHAADGTSVVLEHRGFERHRGDVDRYRAAMASDAGWPSIMDRYRSFVIGSLRDDPP